MAERNDWKERSYSIATRSGMKRRKERNVKESRVFRHENSCYPGVVHLAISIFQWYNMGEPSVVEILGDYSRRIWSE